MIGAILTTTVVMRSTKGHSDNFTIYGNLGWNILDNSNISLFTRIDEHKQTGKNKTYKVNLSKEIKFVNLGFSYMKGLRNPTLYEMFGTDNFGYSGNKSLKPEKSTHMKYIQMYHLMKI